MSWLVTLYDTYNNVFGKPNGPLPIAHTTQNAEVEVILDIGGSFVGSRVVDSEKTIIPCSESSAGRTSKPVPHPLHDKLQYVAGDYTAFGGEKGDESHREYMMELGKWCRSPYANSKVCAVHKYLQKGCLIADLVNEGTLYAQNSKLPDKWTGEKSETPPIFKVVVGKQSDAFVRFCVKGDRDPVINLWENVQVQQDYVNYYLGKQDDKQFCYATGQWMPCSSNHPSKIRHTGDKAKLISANDEMGFTYKGRFDSYNSAVQVSYDVSQKAHNALKWLIEKQGKRFSEKVFLLWGTEDQQMPGLTDDTVDEADLFHDDSETNQEPAYTKDEIARRFNCAISGYKADISSATHLSLIGLDSATTGRLSITFYREFHGLEGNELFDRINAWHRECAWFHRYKFKDKKPIVFEGVPASGDIATVAFGTEQGNFIKANEKVVGKTVERLLPCITDGAAIPADIVRALVRKAQQPQNYSNVFNWNKVLSITCAVYRKHLNDKSNKIGAEEWKMGVDKDCPDIAYNCGRLLAVADAIEKRFFYYQREERPTNAIRYFSKFAENPCKTWGIISSKISHCIEKLGKRGNDLYKLREDISSKIPPAQFAKLKNLDGRMVLGFDAQRNEIINKNVNKDNKEMEDNDQ